MTAPAQEPRISINYEDVSDNPGLVLDPDTNEVIRINPDGSRTVITSPGGGGGIPQGGPLTEDLDAATHTIQNLNALELIHTVTISPDGADEPSLKIGESTEPPTDSDHAQLFLDSGILKAKLPDDSVSAIAPNGGSSAVSTVQVDFAFDTPDILTGIPFYTAEDGDYFLIYESWLSTPTAWDGTTPTLYIYPEGSDRATSSILGAPQGIGGVVTDTPLGTTGHGFVPVFTALGGTFYFTGTTPLLLAVDDGSGGDPGCSHGVGKYTLPVWRAS